LSFEKVVIRVADLLPEREGYTTGRVRRERLVGPA
jgi:hypothetical protein